MKKRRRELGLKKKRKKKEKEKEKREEEREKGGTLRFGGALGLRGERRVFLLT